MKPLALKYRKRLLNVARALRESPKPRDFTMRRYTNHCETPACAFGHYMHRADLQRSFKPAPDGWPLARIGRRVVAVVFRDDIVQEHFGIGRGEAERLFGPSGCDGARGPREAARYIERFVKARTP